MDIHGGRAFDHYSKNGGRASCQKIACRRAGHLTKIFKCLGFAGRLPGRGMFADGNDLHIKVGLTVS